MDRLQEKATDPGENPALPLELLAFQLAKHIV
jgi:hypothetical protein